MNLDESWWILSCWTRTYQNHPSPPLIENHRIYIVLGRPSLHRLHPFLRHSQTTWLWRWRQVPLRFGGPKMPKTSKTPWAEQTPTTRNISNSFYFATSIWRNCNRHRFCARQQATPKARKVLSQHWHLRVGYQKKTRTSSCVEGKNDNGPGHAQRTPQSFLRNRMQKTRLYSLSQRKVLFDPCLLKGCPKRQSTTKTWRTAKEAMLSAAAPILGFPPLLTSSTDKLVDA